MKRKVQSENLLQTQNAVLMESNPDKILTYKKYLNYL